MKTKVYTPVTLMKQLKYVPVKRQVEIFKRFFLGDRFLVLIAGRRFGKTMAMAVLVMMYLLQKDKKVGVVAPQYRQAEKTWNYIKDWCLKYFPMISKGMNRQTWTINSPTGTKAFFMSADNEDSLVSEGYDLLILDEAARLKQRVWTQALRPSLSDRGREGRAIFITSPIKVEWLYQLYKWGKEGKHGYYSLQFTSKDGAMNEEEYELVRQEYIKMGLENLFTQEYGGEFIDLGGTFFKSFKDCFVGEYLEEGERCTWRPFDPSHRYIIAADLAKERDYTVIGVLDLMTHEVVARDRFNQIDWEIQKERIVNLYQEYGGDKNVDELRLDASGVGSPIVDDLRNMGIPVRGITIKATGEPVKDKISKADLVINLRMILGREMVKLAKDTQIIHELEVYEEQFNETTGRSTYNAPTGDHDDCVMMLAILLWDMYDKLETTKKQKEPDSELKRRMLASREQMLNKSNKLTEPQLW